MKTYKPDHNGIFIYAGIDEFEKEICEIFYSIVKCNIFYYNCSNKFCIDIAKDYIYDKLSDLNGNIIFASGDECIIYTLDKGVFKKLYQFDALLQKRQHKGGQSAQRIARLAEETRHKYVTKVIDKLNHINNNNNYLLGSDEITNMICNHKYLLKQITHCGFLEFNNRTILNTKNWIQLFKDHQNNNNFDNIYKLIYNCLNTDIERLSFDYIDINDNTIMDEYKYILKKDIDTNNNCDKIIPFPDSSSEYYLKLKDFTHISLKYYSSYYDNVDEC